MTSTEPADERQQIERVIRKYFSTVWGRRSMAHVCEYADEIASELAERIAVLPDAPVRSCGQCGTEPMKAAPASGGGWLLTCPDCSYRTCVYSPAPVRCDQCGYWIDGSGGCGCGRGATG